MFVGKQIRQAGEIRGLRSLWGGLDRVLIASDVQHALMHSLTESAGRIGTPKIRFCEYFPKSFSLCWLVFFHFMIVFSVMCDHIVLMTT
jgi:hypothetical protein